MVYFFLQYDNGRLKEWVKTHSFLIRLKQQCITHPLATSHGKGFILAGVKPFHIHLCKLNLQKEGSLK
jgi:hypothetical protein